MRLVLVERPCVDAAFGGLERFPLYWKNVSQDFTEGLALFCRCTFVEYDQSPLHLALGEVATQIAGDPELAASETGSAVVTGVDFVGVVELAVVFHFPVVMVSRGMRVEITHAEVWTAACFDCSGVDGPARRRRRMTGADAEQGDNHKQSDSVHRNTPMARKHKPNAVAAQEIKIGMLGAAISRRRPRPVACCLISNGC